MARLNRRQFLGHSLGAAAAATVAPSWLASAAGSAEDSERILVVLQLQGGNDGLSTITPKEDDRYYRGRKFIGIRKERLIALDELNGFHPLLRRTAERYRRGQMAIQQAVGYPNPNLSHFISQDIWDAASTAAPLPSTGWVGNLHDQLGVRDSVGMLSVGRDTMPFALRATEGVACVVPSLDSYRIRSAPVGSSTDEARARARAIAALNGRREDEGEDRLAAAFQAANVSIAELERVKSFRTKAEFPGSQLGVDLRLVARVIGAGLPTRLFYVTHGGFDTHTDQVRVQDKLLGQFDIALDSFLAEMEKQGRLDQVVVMTISDFGRRIEESGIGDTAGTDHGAANSLMLFGGSVHAGLHGGQPDLENLDENGNLVMKTDFRQIYADVIDSWLGGDSSKVLGQTFEKVKVVA